MEDVKILRALARKYLRYANDDSMGDIRKLHRGVNDLKMIRPVVLIDEIPWGELNVNGELTPKCVDPDFRAIEDFMLKQIYKYENFRADMILRPYLPVQKVIHRSDIGVGISEHTLKDNPESGVSSHEYVDMFEDCEGLEKLHNQTITYDEEETNRRFNKIANAVGDIIPIRKTGIDYASIVTWDNISELRGVTPLLMDLLAEPEFSHQLVEKMTDIIIDRNEQMRKLGLFDADPINLHQTPLLNSTLHPELDNKDLSNVWGRGAAQIFSSVSKEMQDEFETPYMQKALNGFGLVYYGCCEALDKKIDIVEKLPNLRKISISPWADVNNAAEIIGKKYVLATKPNPALVAVGDLDEEVVKKEIVNICDACYKNNCSFDIVLKDISTVARRPQNLIKWEKIAMDIVRNY